MAEDFKDLFSGHAADYAKYRPHYPDALFRYIADHCPDRNVAWDVGTGNGQAAVALAKYFSRVIGTDPAAAQLREATPHAHVEYRSAAAERSGLDDFSVNCVTVAQAFHWFKADEFFAEVRRVTQPGGVLALWCYELATVEKEIDLLVHRLYDDLLGPYWDPERRLVEEGYRNVDVPFNELDVPRFEMEKRWSYQEFLGYIGTWSALKKYQKAKGNEGLGSIADELRDLWVDPSRKREVVFPISMRVFQVS